MNEAINHLDPAAEFYTPERCYIIELSNTPEDPEVSVARARVAPGITTRWHRVVGVTERYVIVSGTGRMEVGCLAPQDVSAGDVVLIPPSCRQRIRNTGAADLVFLAICSPRFQPQLYEDIDGHGPKGTAARIRALRVRAGKSQEEMSQLLDLNAAWYADLESRDEELTSTLTLFQAMQLASALGVRLHELLDESPPPAELVSLMDLPGRISEHLAREGISIGQLEDRVGWELGDLIDSPLQAAAELPLIFLQAVADELGIDWLSLIAEDEAP